MTRRTIRPELEALARRNGVADRVRFLGPAHDERKWALLAQARMLVLPSYSENFGNVVLEAMASGCPVIVTPEVGIAPRSGGRLWSCVCRRSNKAWVRDEAVARRS